MSIWLVPFFSVPLAAQLQLVSLKSQLQNPAPTDGRDWQRM